MLIVPKEATKNIIKNVVQFINNDTTLVSIVPSLSIDELESDVLQDQHIVSLYPNTTVEIHKGIIGYVNNSHVDEELIYSLLRPLGKLFKINKNEAEIFSTVSGCGPAIVDLFIESLSDGAVLNGMNRALSYELMPEMIIGAAQLLKVSNQHPGIIKDKVCSPGGHTIKAIHTLEKHAFRYTLSDAMNSVND